MYFYLLLKRITQGVSGRIDTCICMAESLCCPFETISTLLISYACVGTKSLQLCLTLRNPMDCSAPGSPVHGILQARTLEWVAVSSSRECPDPGMEFTSLTSPALAGTFFTTSAAWFSLNQHLVWSLEHFPTFNIIFFFLLFCIGFHFF